MSAPAPAFLERRGPSDLDRPAWLKARRNGLTASEMAEIGSRKTPAGRRACMEKIAADKIASSEDDWRGARMDRYRRWGKEREPILEEWANFAFGFTPESRIAFAADNPAHMASVDGWRLDAEGVHLAEHKTTNKPLDHDLIVEKGYDDQVQWQMHVTEAVDTMVFWEERLDDPDSDTGFKAGVRGTVLIVRDQKRIDILLGYAVEFLSILHERAFGDDGASDDPMLDDLVTRLETAKKDVKQLDPQVRQMMTSLKSTKTAHWEVSYETSDPKDVPDLDKFQAEHPEEAATIAAIYAERSAQAAATALHRADEADAIIALAAKYTKKGEPGNPTLRITPRKDVK